MLWKLFRIGSWDSLRTIGNSYVSLISILVPVFGYLIFAADFFSIGYAAALDFAESKGVELQIDLPTNFLRVKMTYVGLSIVGLTALLFKITCPKNISVYEDGTDFALKSIEIAHEGSMDRIRKDLDRPVWYQKALETYDGSTIELKNHYEGSLASVRARVGDQARLKRSEWIEQNLDQLNKGFLMKYERVNFSLFALRAIIFVGFALGYFITLVPGLQMLGPPFVEVITYLKGISSWQA
jgi:hypothetical protein